MKPGIEIHLKRVAYHLAMKHRQVTGSLFIQSARPLLQQRSLPLPPLTSGHSLGLPIDTLLSHVYSEKPMDRAFFFSVWDYMAAITRQGGWLPAKPFFEMVALMYPDLKQPEHTPKGVEFDTRGLLCQALFIANYRLEGSVIRGGRDDVWLKIGSKVIAGISSSAITWKNGHYICRTLKDTPIDFRLWPLKPMHGSRALTPEAAALRLRLMHVLPDDAQHIDTVFRCVAMLGADADFTICEPFYIQLTDDPVDQSGYLTTLLDAQRKLKAKR